MTCTHERHYQVLTIVDHDDNFEAVYELEDRTDSTMVDIDLHRMKCSECGHVAYYSERARLFFEEGIENETYGLTTFNLIKYGGYIKGRK